MTLSVVFFRPVADGNIRLGLALARRDRRLNTDKPIVAERPPQAPLDPCDGSRVLRILRHLVYDPAFEQLDGIVLGEHTGLDHAMVLSHGELMNRQGRRRRENRHLETLPFSDQQAYHNPGSSRWAGGLRAPVRLTSCRRPPFSSVLQTPGLQTPRPCPPTPAKPGPQSSPPGPRSAHSEWGL